MNEKKIESYIFSLIEKEKLFDNLDDQFERVEAEKYLSNAIADAEFTLNLLEPYLNHNIKILEVGGGLHLLSSYLLKQGYEITSIEPGGFSFYIDKLRNNILNILNSNNIYSTSLEDFETQKKFDLIFSVNVLEHTDSILEHIKCQINLLKDKSSRALFRAPNYNIPFEPHFYKFFIPFLPHFTFKSLFRKKLIEEYGERRYLEIFESINFDCKFSFINKYFSIDIKNPLAEIIKRLESDKIFNERILKNNKVKIIYKTLNFFKLNYLLNFLPKRFYPYLIFEIKK